MGSSILWNCLINKSTELFLLFKELLEWARINMKLSWTMDSEHDKALEDEMAMRVQLMNALRVPGSLRPIVIDGMDVAFAHGNDQKFSAQGLTIAFNYFRSNGWEMEDIKIFVRREGRYDQAAQEDKDLCERMNKAGIVIWALGIFDDT